MGAWSMLLPTFVGLELFDRQFPRRLLYLLGRTYRHISFQAPESIHRNVHVYTENCCLMHTPGLRPLFTRMDKVSIQYLVATWLIGFYSGDLDHEFFGE